MPTAWITAAVLLASLASYWGLHRLIRVWPPSTHRSRAWLVPGLAIALGAALWVAAFGAARGIVIGLLMQGGLAIVAAFVHGLRQHRNRH